MKKVCAYCTKPYPRRLKVSIRAYQASRFCSTECRIAEQRKVPRAPAVLRGGGA